MPRQEVSQHVNAPELQSGGAIHSTLHMSASGWLCCAVCGCRCPAPACRELVPSHMWSKFLSDDEMAKFNSFNLKCVTHTKTPHTHTHTQREGMCHFPSVSVCVQRFCGVEFQHALVPGGSVRQRRRGQELHRRRQMHLRQLVGANKHMKETNGWMAPVAPACAHRIEAGWSVNACVCLCG